MTVFAKDTTYGLETSVLRVQNLLNDNLPWLGTNNIYGIVFKNAKKDDVIPEAWIGNSGREYKEVFCNDKATSQIGFIVLDRDIISKSATVKIIVTINLEKAYNSSIRDNERAYLDFEKALKNSISFKDSVFNQGINDVFTGFRTNNIKYLDMQPFDCFSFELIMFYSSNLPC